MTPLLPDLTDIGYRAFNRFENTDIYAVEALGTGQLYALKRIWCSSDEEAEAEFEYAARLGKLGCTVSVQEMRKCPGPDGGLYACLVLQKCERGSLADYMADLRKRNARPAELHMRGFVAQVHDALKVLHSSGVCHLNITPDHLLFQARGPVFAGIRRRDPAAFSPASLPQPPAGSRAVVPDQAYMAPELVPGGPGGSSKSDLYSFGVLILELCRVDHWLPEGDGPAFLYQRLLEDEAVEHARVAAALKQRGYDSEFETLIVGLLACDPAKRSDLSAVSRFLAPVPELPDLSAHGYKVTGQIGKGGNARVFLVEHLATGVPYALKDSRVPNASQKKDIEKEKTFLESVAHPNIVKYYDCFYRKNPRGMLHYCLVMELCQKSLDTVIMEQGEAAFKEERILSFLRQLCDATAHLHSRRIFHRDITPRNILFTDAGGLRLIDFGISNTFGEMASNPRTTRIGTPNYVSPEVYKGDKQSEKIDMWGIGAITLDLCGVLKLEKLSLHDRIRHNEKQEHQRIRDDLVSRGYSAALASLCVSLVQEDPRKRPSAEEVLRTLESFGAPVGEC